MTLIKWSQFSACKSFSFIESPSFYSIIINANVLVRVLDCQTERQIVVQGVVIESKFSEGGVSGVEFDGTGAENQPADEDNEAQDEQNGEDYLADAGA